VTFPSELSPLRTVTIQPCLGNRLEDLGQSDSLIVLISSDWFLRNSVSRSLLEGMSGVEMAKVNGAAKGAIKSLMQQARTYYELSFTPHRIAETRQSFVEGCGQGSDIQVVMDLLDRIEGLDKRDFDLLWTFKIAFSDAENRASLPSDVLGVLDEVDKLIEAGTNCHTNWDEQLDSFMSIGMPDESFLIDYFSSQIAGFVLIRVAQTAGLLDEGDEYWGRISSRALSRGIPGFSRDDLRRLASKSQAMRK
jgi:hypothetical protein